MKVNKLLDKHPIKPGEEVTFQDMGKLHNPSDKIVYVTLHQDEEQRDLTELENFKALLPKFDETFH